MRAVGLVKNVQDIENTVIKSQNGTRAARERHRRGDPGSEDPAGTDSARRSTGKTATSSITTTWSKASCCCARAPNRIRRSQGIQAKVKELNDHLLPPGVKVVPFLDRSDLVHYTTHTVLHNLTEGIMLVAIVLFFFLGNVRGAFIVALTIPFSLLFAAIVWISGTSRRICCRWERWISAWWWMAPW